MAIDRTEASSGRSERQSDRFDSTASYQDRAGSNPERTGDPRTAGGTMASAEARQANATGDRATITSLSKLTPATDVDLPSSGGAATVEHTTYGQGHDSGGAVSLAPAGSDASERQTNTECSRNVSESEGYSAARAVDDLTDPSEAKTANGTGDVPTPGEDNQACKSNETDSDPAGNVQTKEGVEQQEQAADEIAGSEERQEPTGRAQDGLGNSIGDNEVSTSWSETTVEMDEGDRIGSDEPESPSGVEGRIIAMDTSFVLGDAYRFSEEPPVWTSVGLTDEGVAFIDVDRDANPVAVSVEGGDGVKTHTDALGTETSFPDGSWQYDMAPEPVVAERAEGEERTPNSTQGGERSESTDPPVAKAEPVSDTQAASDTKSENDKAEADMDPGRSELPVEAEAAPPEGEAGVSEIPNDTATPGGPDIVAEVLEGSFYSGNTTWAGTAANVAIGFVPIVGQIADARDTAAAVSDVWENPSSGQNWGALGLAAVGWLPGIGDAIKGGGRLAGKAAREFAAEGLEEAAAATVQRSIRNVADDVSSGASGRVERAAAEDTGNVSSSDVENSLEATFRGGKDEGAYDTTQRLIRGNLGEKLAADALAADGHTILSYKPSVLGTNQGGIDIVTIKDGTVHFVDNKALRSSGNVSSVSALTANFDKNKDAFLTELREAMASAASNEEKAILGTAISAIENGAYKKVVTNANWTPDNTIASGLSASLKREGLEFINVFR